eukprot:COSAG02_NODE_30760_length_545_cov_50.677130_1_plen_130_part_10
MTLSLQNTGIGPLTLRKLATSLPAVVDEMNVSMNPIGVDGAKALGEVLPESSLKCLIIGPKSTRLRVNDAEVTELNFEGHKFTPTEVMLVAKAISTMAAVEAVVLAQNKLGGRTVDLASNAAILDAPTVG